MKPTKPDINWYFENANKRKIYLQTVDSIVITFHTNVAGGSLAHSLERHHCLWAWAKDTPAVFSYDFCTS